MMYQRTHKIIIEESKCRLLNKDEEAGGKCEHTAAYALTSVPAPDPLILYPTEIYANTNYLLSEFLSNRVYFQRIPRLMVFYLKAQELVNRSERHFILCRNVNSASLVSLLINKLYLLV